MASFAQPKDQMEEMSSYDFLFKVIIIGNPSCGKSSLMLRYVEDKEPEYYVSTIGVDFKLKSIKLGKKIIKMQIWDTAGQERFRPLTTGYYRNAHACIVVFDLTNEDSFHSVSKWVDQFSNGCTYESASILILGTKSDLVEQRRISFEEGKSLADRLGHDYMECSSKTKHNVDEVFTFTAKKIMDNEQLHKAMNQGRETIQIKPFQSEVEKLDVTVKKRGCC